MKHLLPVSLVFCLGFVTASAAEDPVEARIRNVLQDQQLTGAAWAFVYEDGEIRTGATGVANAATGVSFSVDARFHVGSVAKTVLATGVLRLVSQGRIDLDLPVSRYLPEIRFDNPWADAHPVTVRNLLDHTSGLEDTHLWQMFSASISPDTPLLHAYTRTDGVLRVRSRPGSRLSYSNMGYGLLGMLIESMTGTRYEEYLDRNLLAPLGMHDSTFRYTTQEGPAADPSLVWGHTDNGAPHAAVPVMLRPGAQFTTTAHDLAVFARFLMSDGDVEGARFIHPELMRARGHASTTEAAAAGLEAGYAFGLSRWDRFGAIGYCHSGNIVGFKALLCAYPDAGKAFVVSMNTDSETANYTRIFEILATHLDIAPPGETPSGTPAANVAEWTGWYRLEPNRFEQFAYLDALFANVDVRWNGEALTLAPVPGEKRVLRPSGGYFFVAADRSTNSHVLMRDHTGRELISDGYRTYVKTSLFGLALLWLSLAGGVLGLLWFFVAGLVVLVKHRHAAWRRAEIIPFVGVLALLLPIPFFFTQSFIRLGDVTPASVLLAIATGLLPVFMLVALWRFRPSQGNPFALTHAVFALCVLQWCVVLIRFDILPLRLWS